MSWFVAPTTQMSICVLFVSARVSLDGAFSLWVSLTAAKWKISNEDEYFKYWIIFFFWNTNQRRLPLTSWTIFGLIHISHPIVKWLLKVQGMAFSCSITTGVFVNICSEIFGKLTVFISYILLMFFCLYFCFDKTILRKTKIQDKRNPIEHHQQQKQY